MSFARSTDYLPEGPDPSAPAGKGALLLCALAGVRVVSAPEFGHSYFSVVFKDFIFLRNRSTQRGARTQHPEIESHVLHELSGPGAPSLSILRGLWWWLAVASFCLCFPDDI